MKYFFSYALTLLMLLNPLSLFGGPAGGRDPNQPPRIGERYSPTMDGDPQMYPGQYSGGPQQLNSTVLNENVRSIISQCPLLPEQTPTLDTVQTLFQQLATNIQHQQMQDRQEGNTCDLQAIQLNNFSTLMEQYSNYLGRNRGVTSQGSQLTCSNYSGILNSQYRQFIAKIDQGLLRPSSSHLNATAFDACLNRAPQAATDCANQTLLSSLNEWESRCSNIEIAANQEIENNAIYETLDGINRISTQLAEVLANPDCSQSQGTTNLLSSAVSFATAFGSSAAGISPLGLGISLAGDFFATLIRSIGRNSTTTEDLLRELSERIQTDQNMCMLRELENIGMGCEKSRLQDERADFLITTCNQELSSTPFDENLNDFFTAVREVNNFSQASGSSNSATLVDNLIRSFNVGPNQDIGEFIQSSVRSLTANDRLTNSEDTLNYESYLNVFSDGEFQASVNDPIRRSEIVREYQRFVGSPGQQNSDSIINRYQGVFNLLLEYKSNIIAQGTPPNYTPFTERESDAQRIISEIQQLVTSSGMSFAEITSKILALSSSTDSSNSVTAFSSNAAISFNLYSRLENYDFAIAESERNTDLHEDQLRVFYDVSNRNNPILQSIMNLLERKHNEMEAVSGLFSPSTSREIRQNAYNSFIEPVLHRCAYAQTLLSSNSNGGYLSVADSFKHRNYQRICGMFFCSDFENQSDNPGLERFNHSEMCENGEPRNSLGCGETYQDFVCHRKSEDYQRVIFNNFEEEYLNSGTICGRRPEVQRIR